jgi:hypothetical protein
MQLVGHVVMAFPFFHYSHPLSPEEDHVLPVSLLLCLKVIDVEGIVNIAPS